MFLIKPVKGIFLEPHCRQRRMLNTKHNELYVLYRDNATNKGKTTIPHTFNWNIVSDLQGPEFYSMSPGHKSSQWYTSTYVAVNQTHLEVRRVC